MIPLLLEYWKPIKGFEGYYEISNLGHVYSIRTKKRIRGGILKGSGYPVIMLRVDKVYKNFTRHSLVATHFIGDRPVGMQVNHKDGVKTNSRVSNLEYTTPGGNTQHAYDIGLTPRGEQHPHARIDSKIAKEIYQLKGVLSQQKIAERFGITRAIVMDIHQGNTWRHALE